MSISVDIQHPPQRTFKPRRRALSPARVVAYERSMSRWGLGVEGPQLSFSEVFGTVGDVVLDIGFGGGEALIELAEVRPAECVIAIDVHTPGVAAVLEAIEARGLRNVRVVEGDVIDFMPRVPMGSLAEIRVYFPDPWPKHRQRTRRLIRADVIDRLVPLMRGNGVLHIATDSAEYARQVDDVCRQHPALSGGVVQRPAWRPTTRFERRGADEGRASVDLIFNASTTRR